MTFPDTKYPEIGSFFDDYADHLAAAAASVDRDRLAAAAGLLDAAYQRNAAVFICGNGGSAAIANTFVCDHAKLVQTDTDLTPRVISLSANVPMISAIANDLSYDDVFLYQLRTTALRGDLVVCISASGDSENVVRAATWAGANGVEVVAFTGFSGGRMAGLAHAHVHVEADNYGIVEDMHQSLMHVLAQYIRQTRMSEALIAERKF